MHRIVHCSVLELSFVYRAYDGFNRSISDSCLPAFHSSIHPTRYETICMLRKMLLSAVLVLLQDDPGNQTFALSLLSVGYLTIHSYVKPYSSMELNELETGTLFVTVLTLSLCTFYYSQEGEEGSNAVLEKPLTWTVITASILLALWSLFLIIRDTFGLFKSGLLAERRMRNSTFWLARKMTLKASAEGMGTPSKHEPLLDDLASPDRAYASLNPLHGADSTNGRDFSPLIKLDTPSTSDAGPSTMYLNKSFNPLMMSDDGSSKSSKKKGKGKGKAITDLPTMRVISSPGSSDTKEERGGTFSDYIRSPEEAPGEGDQGNLPLSRTFNPLMASRPDKGTSQKAKALQKLPSTKKIRVDEPQSCRLTYRALSQQIFVKEAGDTVNPLLRTESQSGSGALPDGKNVQMYKQVETTAKPAALLSALKTDEDVHSSNPLFAGATKRDDARFEHEAASETSSDGDDDGQAFGALPSSATLRKKKVAPPKPPPKPPALFASLQEDKPVSLDNPLFAGGASDEEEEEVNPLWSAGANTD